MSMYREISFNFLRSVSKPFRKMSPALLCHRPPRDLRIYSSLPLLPDVPRPLPLPALPRRYAGRLRKRFISDSCRAAAAAAGDWLRVRGTCSCVWHAPTYRHQLMSWPHSMQDASAGPATGDSRRPAAIYLFRRVECECRGVAGCEPRCWRSLGEARQGSVIATCVHESALARRPIVGRHGHGPFLSGNLVMPPSRARWTRPWPLGRALGDSEWEYSSPAGALFLSASRTERTGQDRDRVMERAQPGAAVER